MAETVHATCVAIGGRGVLLLGASGAGKSDLALRLIDRGARLVSDDGTIVRADGDRLLARAGPHLADRIEVRGLGIVTIPALAEAPVALAIALDQAPPRMPEERLPTRRFDGIAIPLLALEPHAASAPIKVEKALALYGLAA